jgi:hypothetical protein
MTARPWPTLAPITPPRGITAQGLAWAAAILCTYALMGDWLPAAALVVLWLIWHILPEPGMPPVFALAVSTQWLQVVAALFYYSVTGRSHWMWDPDLVRPFVQVGLLGVTALALGVAAGRRNRRTSALSSASLPLSDRAVALWYFGVMIGSLALMQLAYRTPALAGLLQGFVMLAGARLALLFVLLSRLVRPPGRWGAVVGLLLWEIGFGLSGFFGSFKEPMVVFVLVLISRFDRRRLAHWTALGTAVLSLGGLSLMWTAIKPTYRAMLAEDEQGRLTRSDRFAVVRTLGADWYRGGSRELAENLDATVNRISAVYFPALAFQRVPRDAPYAGGEFFWHAISHILTPRLLFPDKAPLLSDSEKVRKYSGVYVAGEETGTSIAFGYVAEMFVDFGLPWLLLPVAALGWMIAALCGVAERQLQSREMALGFVTYFAWFALYLFERSWDKMIGQSLTLFLAVGGAVLVAERSLFAAARQQR